MLRILVAHSYFLKLDPKQLERAKPYPPLATLQAAALLRGAGHRVELFDAMLADPAEFPHRLQQSRPRVLVLYEDNYNFLTKMCLAEMRAAACEMIREARRADARVIVAGSDATDDPEPYLKAGGDLVLRGEGLLALERVVARLDEQPHLAPAELAQGLTGVVTLEGRAATPRSGPPRHADTEPAVPQPALAAWDLVDVERYRAMWQRVHGRFSLNMAASRGCSFRCAWCAKPIWGSRYLQRPAAEVAAELTHLKRAFAPDHVWFADDIFGFRVDWVLELAAALRAADAIVPFTIQTRADLVSPRMAAALHEAGCREAWIGAESGSQRILDTMRKGVAVAEIIAARARLGAHGIRVGFFIQLGYLGEQLADLLATRELIETARPDEVGVSVAYPLPGTPFYDQVKNWLGAKTHWRDSGDLTMMFPGTYTTEFYRAVRDLLHAEMDVQKLGAASSVPSSRQARIELDRRWDTLIAREGEFRNENGPITRTLHA
ncbi:MAG TPA: radical SAM protein [Steroidobacteraceae bacterium]|nr:radical SAM protein [Steroidobacteraceae bacterium]